MIAEMQRFPKENMTKAPEIQCLFVLPHRQVQDYTEIHVSIGKNLMLPRMCLPKDDRGNNTRAAIRNSHENK